MVSIRDSVKFVIVKSDVESQVYNQGSELDLLCKNFEERLRSEFFSKSKFQA